jgi:hypothetical protein
MRKLKAMAQLKKMLVVMIKKLKLKAINLRSPLREKSN